MIDASPEHLLLVCLFFYCFPLTFVMSSIYLHIYLISMSVSRSRTKPERLSSAVYRSSLYEAGKEGDGIEETEELHAEWK